MYYIIVILSRGGGGGREGRTQNPVIHCPGGLGPGIRRTPGPRMFRTIFRGACNPIHITDNTFLQTHARTVYVLHTNVIS